MNTHHGIRQASVSVLALRHTLRRRPHVQRALGALMLCCTWMHNVTALPIGSFDHTPTSPGTLAPSDPGGPIYAPIVNVPLAFTITGRDATWVGLSWWQQDTPQTHVMRSVNGGPWTTIKTYGALPLNAMFQFTDQQATPDAEHCYVVVATDGWTRLSTPQRCALTRDGRDFPVHRLQLRLRVPDIANAGTDDDVKVSLQSPAGMVTAVTNWYPAGNHTWIDSTADDFERSSGAPNGARSLYDLMVTNISQASDITIISVSKTGHDDLCIAEVELRIDGTLAFQRTFGDTATTCVWVTNDHSLFIDFDELRADYTWRRMSPNTFTGFNGAGLRSLIEAHFAHTLHGSEAELRNGGTTVTQYLSASRLHVAVPLVVRDVWWGPVYLGDVDSTVSFDLVLTPVEVHGVPKTQLSIENVDADSYDLLVIFLPLPVVPMLYEISSQIEDRLKDLGAFILDSPSGSSVLCFTPPQEPGISLCGQ